MIILDESNIVYYLLSKGLLTYEGIVNGDVWVEKLHSRNNNYAIHSNQKNAFVKQVATFDAGNVDTLRRESFIYWLTENNQNFYNLKKYLSAIIDYNYDEHILITELLKDYKNLNEWLSYEKTFNDLGVLKAQVLSSYHFDITNILETDKISGFFKFSTPWSFEIAKGKKEWFKLVTPSDFELFDIIQKDSFFNDCSEKMLAEWSPTSLIHGDVKWSNFMVNKIDGKTDVRLIDWEIADIGDPAWDVGCVIQNYIYDWARYSFVNNERKSVIKNQEIGLCFGQFWDLYKLNIEESIDKDAFLLKSINFSAFRMLQILLEASHHRQKISKEMVMLLQLSQNILKNPESVLTQLFNYTT